MELTWAEFKQKWARYAGKESFAYQEYLIDLCRLPGHPTGLSDEQILERLLALNLERVAEEEKVPKVKKPKAQRTKHAEETL